MTGHRIVGRVYPSITPNSSTEEDDLPGPTDKGPPDERHPVMLVFRWLRTALGAVARWQAHAARPVVVPARTDSEQTEAPMKPRSPRSPMVG